MKSTFLKFMQRTAVHHETISPAVWLYDKLFPLPSVCPVCMRPNARLQVCDRCRADVLRKRSLYGQCQRCHSFGVYSSACSNCRAWPNYYVGNWAAWPYQGAYKQVIQEFKFRNMPWLADTLAQEMLPYLPKNYDLLVPVPLHPNRLQQRGYNQSELLVRSLSRLSGIPWQSSIVRVRDTPHQTGLNRTERLQNLHQAFACSSYADIKGKRIIMVDDVFTTGTTLLSCAKTLHQNGAKEIISCTIASGHGHF